MSGWSSIGAAGVWVYLLLIVALLLYANLKLWRIRHGMFRIADDAAKARRESEGLFSQLQSLMALERKLALSDALPPMRGWAGSPDFLLEVADQVHGRRPHTVVECGCGVSTIVMARCLQLNNSGHVYSMEHDPAFVVRTRSLLRRYGLSDWATVLHAPLKTVGTYTAWL